MRLPQRWNTNAPEYCLVVMCVCVILLLCSTLISLQFSLHYSIPFSACGRPVPAPVKPIYGILSPGHGYAQLNLFFPINTERVCFDITEFISDTLAICFPASV